MRTLAVLTLLAVVLGAAGRPEGAMSVANCGYVEFCGGNGHQFIPLAEANENPHGNCIGPCDPFEGGGACHPLCRDWFADEPELESNYSALIAAANEGDIAAVVSLAEHFPTHVGYNRARQSVQILNCDGTAVIANLPIRPGVALSAAEDLPSAEGIFRSSSSNYR